MIFEEYKYVVKEKTMPNYITDDIEVSSDEFFLIIPMTYMNLMKDNLLLINTQNVCAL